MDCVAAVGVLEWIGFACHLHPAQAHGNLRPECVAAGLVGFAVALGLFELEIQGIGHVLAAGLAVRRHAPVGTGLGLVALDGQQRRADHVLNGRWDAALGLGAQQVRVQLVAIRIVGLFVGGCTPDGLLLDLVQVFLVFVQRQRRCAIRNQGLGGVGVVHSVQSWGVSSASQAPGLLRILWRWSRWPACRFPWPAPTGAKRRRLHCSHSICRAGRGNGSPTG